MKLLKLTVCRVANIVMKPIRAYINFVKNIDIDKVANFCYIAIRFILPVWAILAVIEIVITFWQ